MLAVAPGLQTHLTAFPAGSPHEHTSGPGISNHTLFRSPSATIHRCRFPSHAHPR